MKYLLALSVLIGNLAYGQYSLGLNLEKGHTYFLHIKTTMRLDGEMNGQKMGGSSTMTALAKFKVLRASDLEYELEASYDSVHLGIKSPMGSMEFSSNNGASDQDMPSGGLNMMTQRHFNITLLKNGAVKKINNPDTAGISSLLKNIPMIEGIKKMLMMGQIKHSFNPQIMRENLEKLTALFPNKKVSLNEEWGNTIMPDSGTENRIKTNYRLVDYTSGLATIKGHSESILRSSQRNGNKMPMAFDLSGKSESTITVDASTGWIKESEIQRNLDGHISMKANLGGATAKESPFHLVCTVVMSDK
jgi:hypothetical protein